MGIIIFLDEPTMYLKFDFPSLGLGGVYVLVRLGGGGVSSFTQQENSQNSLLSILGVIPLKARANPFRSCLKYGSKIMDEKDFDCNYNLCLDVKNRGWI